MSTLNKQLQERIGAILNRDYFKLERGKKIKVKDLGEWEFSDFWINNKAPIHFESHGYYIVRHGMTWSGFESEKKCIYQYSNGKKEENKDIEIIGTEPTLQDLLRALGDQFTIRGDGDVYDFIDHEPHFKNISLDLSLSLFSQSDETKQKLLDLIN